MQCPKCYSQALHNSRLQLKNGKLDVKIEYCQRCQGFLLQRDQLQALLGLLSATEKLNTLDGAGELKRGECPNCAQNLYAFCYPGTDVSIDVCQNCTYLWLDENKYQALLQQISPRDKGEFNQAMTQKNYTSYADNIPGIKGRLLRYIDKTMNQLQNSLF